MPQSLQQLAKAALCLPCPSKSQNSLCPFPSGHAWLPGHFNYLPATPACSLPALTPSLAPPSSLHCCTVGMWDSWSHGSTDTEASMHVCVHSSKPLPTRTVRNGVSLAETGQTTQTDAGMAKNRWPLLTAHQSPLSHIPTGFPDPWIFSCWHVFVGLAL